MLKNKKYRSVKTIGTNFMTQSYDRLKDSYIARTGPMNPVLGYHLYRIKDEFKKAKRHIPILAAIFIALFGILIIDSQFQPIQTPAEIYGKLGNLINMCSALALVVAWMYHLKTQKIPIFR